MFLFYLIYFYLNLIISIRFKVGNSQSMNFMEGLSILIACLDSMFSCLSIMFGIFVLCFIIEVIVLCSCFMSCVWSVFCDRIWVIIDFVGVFLSGFSWSWSSFVIVIWRVRESGDRGSRDSLFVILDDRDRSGLIRIICP